MFRVIAVLLIGLVLCSSVFSETPVLQPAVKITECKILGTPIVGSLVQLRIRYTGYVNAAAKLTMVFPGMFVPDGNAAGNTSLTESITLVAGGAGERIFNYRLVTAGSGMVSVSITTETPAVGYRQSDSWYLVVDGTNTTSHVYDQYNQASVQSHTYPAPTTNLVPAQSMPGVQTTVNITGKVKYPVAGTDPVQYVGVPGVRIYLEFSRGVGDLAVHPVFPTGCLGSQHTHYDVTAMDGSYSFTFTFNGLLSDYGAYDEVHLTVNRKNVATRLGLQENQALDFCGNGEYIFTEEKRVSINPANSTITQSGLDPIVNANDGMILRYMMLSRDFMLARYAGVGMPFSLPIIYTGVESNLQSGGHVVAGLFDDDDVKIVMNDRYVDFTAVAHEYGHYANYKMWSDYLPPSSGCSDMLGNTTPDVARHLKEGFATFYSFATRNYSNRVYGDDPIEYDDNAETGLFTSPRYLGMRYTPTYPQAMAVACYLWNLYDSYQASTYELTVLSGDNDCVVDNPVRVFEAYRTPAIDCISKFQNNLTSVGDASLISTYQNMYNYIINESTPTMLAAQVTNLTGTVQAIDELRLSWTNNLYPLAAYPIGAASNRPTGMKVFKKFGAVWTEIYRSTSVISSVVVSSCDISGQYRVTSYNNAGDSYNPPEFAMSTMSIASSAYSGWNQASVPMVVPNFSKSSVWPTATSSALRFEGGAYPATDPLVPGQGYWVQFGAQQSIAYSGTPICSKLINVVPGWNLIGSISQSIQTTRVKSTPTSNVISSYWGTFPGYQQVTTLEPGKGYWVKVNTAGSLELDVASTSYTPPPPGCITPPPSAGGEPSAPELQAPIDNASGVATTTTLAWQASTGATSYHLQASFTSSFTVSQVQHLGIIGTSKVVSGLEAGRTYYWRVRAYNANGYSAYSCVFKFTTQPSAPPPPPDPCENTITSTEALDLLGISDRQGLSQKLYLWNASRSMNAELKGVEMPPRPPHPIPSARFRSNQLVEVIDAGSGAKPIIIDLKDVTYPIVLTWDLKPTNNTRYRLIGKRIKELNGKGSVTIDADAGNELVIIAQASIPCEPPEQYSTTPEEVATEESIPIDYELSQNSPNPFNPSTSITFALPEAGMVQLRVFNVLGEEVANLVDGFIGAGIHTVHWDASFEATGMYFYRITAGSYNETKKMLLVK